MWVRGHSRSLKMAPFESLGIASYLPFHGNYARIGSHFEDIQRQRSLKLVQFESLSAVSYSPSIVTKAVSVAVCEIFSVKKLCDLENRVYRIRLRSLEMAPFDRSHIRLP